MFNARQTTRGLAASLAVATAGFCAAAAATPDANAAANAFFERALDEHLAMEPTLASMLGLRIGYDRWSDPTESGDNERKALAERHLAELRTTIDPAALDDTTRLSWQVFENSEERRIARHRWRNHNYRFDKNGSHVSLPAFLINTHRVESDADAVAHIRRLEGMRTLLQQQLERAVQAAKQGILPPRFVFPYVIEDSRNIDPWSEFGRLALELHRAVRLVVDTGLHAKRWTREQTIRYHVLNSPTGEEAAIRATERYILNPGQATPT